MKKIAVVLALLLLSGCVNFTSRNTKTIKNNTIAQYNKENILTKFFIYPTINGVADPEKEIELRMSLNNSLEYSFNKTGLFGQVSSHVINPDITMDIVVKNNYTECKNCHDATSWTLFLAPSWNSDRYHYQVRITNRRTGRTASFYYYEDVLQVRQLLLVLAMPFAYNSKDNMHSRVFDKIAFEVSRM